MTAPYRAPAAFTPPPSSFPVPLGWATVEVTVDTRERAFVPRLSVVWPSHNHIPAHAMLAVGHYIACLVLLRSEGMGWDVRIVPGAEKGNRPRISVELHLDSDDYRQANVGERVLEQVRALVSP